MLIRCLEKSNGAAKCVWEKTESMHGQEEQDVEIWCRCIGLKAALAARRGQTDVKQVGSVRLWE